MSKWFSVSDKLPKREHSVLFVYWFGDNALRRVGHLGENGVWYTAERGAIEGVTHWAYLPSRRGLTKDAPDLGESVASGSESKPAPKRVI